MLKIQIPLLFVTILIGSCSANQQVYDVYLNNYASQKTVLSIQGGVSSAHPLASKVGLYILQKGGNAVDAAIAVQLALAVVYPQAGNIGGGGFMVMRLKDGTTKALDFREKAPALAHRDMYLDSSGKPQIGKSLRGHLASGVPGTIAGIFESMQYASLTFKDLIQPAIDLAEKGFVITPGIADEFPYADPKYNTMPNDFDGRREWHYGDTLRQPDLARTLKRIRDKGRRDFYEGRTAKLIVEEMKRGGGLINYEDLKNYKAIWRDCMQFTYRGYDIYSMPLPSSGGILLEEMLKMIEPYPLSSYGFGSSKSISLMVEAERRAYKNRAAFLGDADFVDVPVEMLISDSFIKAMMQDYDSTKAGVSKDLGIEMQKESLETTHFSIVDKYGNAVSVTTTLNMPYGSGVVVGNAGFYLNNEMNDFSLKPGTFNVSGGVGGANNSIETGKRMLSSMTPTIITKDNQLFMVLGSPGGTTIPTSVFQTIVDVVDFGMNASDAVKAPKFHHEWLPDIVEVENGFSDSSLNKLKKMGYLINGRGLGRMAIIKKNFDGNWEIVADKRGGKDCAEGY